MIAGGNIKSYMDIAYRRRWWIVVPVAVFLAIGFSLPSKLPKIYRASTTILVTPQGLPSEFAPPTVTTSVQDRVSNIAVQVLSRSYLDKISAEFGLVTDSASESEFAGAAGRISSGVDIEYDTRRFSWFRIVVDDRDPKLAAGIANRLAELFIEQNSVLREQQATGTRDTVGNWMEMRKQELDEKESEIAAYRAKHLWELPERLPVNLRLLDSEELRLEGIGNKIESTRLRISNLRRDERTQAALAEMGGGTSEGVLGPVAELRRLENELAELRIRYTDQNPAVKVKLAKIEEARRVVAQLAPENPDDDPASLAAEGSIQRQITDAEAELAKFEENADRSVAKIAQLTRRIERTPLREQELAELTRDLDSQRGIYQDLVLMNEKASRAQDLESSRKGEQFRIQDAARVPSTPIRPVPSKILLICTAIGFGIGAALTLLLEFLNPRIHNEDEFRAMYPELVILGWIPDMDLKGVRNTGKKRRRRRKPPRVAMLLIGALTTLAGLPLL